MKKKKLLYEGWELKFFDKATNFRNYQFSLFKNYLCGSLAEIGPGNGVYVEKYKQYASKIYLYEPSKNFLKNLRKKKNKKTLIINKFFSIKRNKFDTIVSLDVLEHIKDDNKQIRKYHSSLKKGGHLILIVPAFQFLYSKFDKDINHFKRYNKKGIKKLIEKFKFKIIKLDYFDTIGFFLSLGSKFLSDDYKKNLSKKVFFWDKLIPLSKLLDFFLFNAIGKSLIIVLKKI